MKILYVLDSFYPKIDGPAIVINNISSILNSSKLADVDVLVPKYPKYTDKFPFKVIRCKSIPATEGYRAGLPLLHHNLNKILMQGNYDIIHIHSPFTIGKYAQNFGKKHNIPVINTVHTSYELDFKRKLKSKILQNFMMNYIEKVINKSDYITTVSKGFGLQLISDTYKCRKNVGVIRNATEFKDTDLSPEIEKLKEKHNIKNEFLFLFVGRVVENKNIQFSLECLKKLKESGFKNFKFLIVGEGDYSSKLSELAREYNLSDNIIFTGVIRDRQVLGAYYKMCHLFLFPSVFDTCGIVALEAASFGLSSFMIEGSCAGELIEDGKNGFVSPADSSIWAERLAEIVKDRKQIASMKEYTRKSLCKSWEDIAIEYFDLYKRILLLHSMKNCKKETNIKRIDLKPAKKKSGIYHIYNVMVKHK